MSQTIVPSTPCVESESAAERVRSTLGAAADILWRTMRRPLRLSEQQAEDVRQEVLCDLVQRAARDGGFPPIDNLQAFLCTAFRHKAATLEKRRRREAEVLADYAVQYAHQGVGYSTESAASEWPDQAECSDESALVDCFLRFLAANCVSTNADVPTLVRRVVEGSSPAEVRRVLAISRATWTRRMRVIRDLCKRYCTHDTGALGLPENCLGSASETQQEPCLR